MSDEMLEKTEAKVIPVPVSHHQWTYQQKPLTTLIDAQRLPHIPRRPKQGEQFSAESSVSVLLPP
ncbi:hypothetical protein EJB05_29947 [Eragrostis curvula]|uniref:Uncharacterized protein n=1 Tax=Eragrostis curvula TaxID=38414 RepID=A0A5J9UU62_9POAL|nr:hypothetical protein EJB05_29884 [Eragrostis curvula]TVU27342.1 hypothetical protein EJB05_29947 [Eragrostis curvula]